MLRRQFQTVLVLAECLLEQRAVTEDALNRSEIIRDFMELRDSGASVSNLVDILNLLMYRLSMLICY